ncbi:MAG: hypothetical protein AB7S77_24150 [Desulfatirhabdiaceae bacterium]
MFPEFEKFVKDHNLLEKKFGGNLAAQIPRILGQGKTKAVGLDLPPAPIERKQEFVNLDLPESYNVPDAVKKERLSVQSELEIELIQLCSEEGARRLASNVIRSLQTEPAAGLKNNYFHAGLFLLIPDKKRATWSWSITSHYPIIQKIPPDFDYLIKAFSIAEEKVGQLVIPVDEFEKRMDLSWLMARHFTATGDPILLSDVARMYAIASQDKKFWNNPRKNNFSDIPEASFIANLINYKRNYTSSAEPLFEFMPATLNDSYTKEVYHIPLDREGTQTRPYVYIIKKRIQHKPEEKIGNP